MQALIHLDADCHNHFLQEKVIHSTVAFFG